MRSKKRGERATQGLGRVQRGWRGGPGQRAGARAVGFRSVGMLMLSGGCKTFGNHQKTAGFGRAGVPGRGAGGPAAAASLGRASPLGLGPRLPARQIRAWLCK